MTDPGYLCRYEWEDDGDDDLRATVDDVRATVEPMVRSNGDVVPGWYHWNVRTEWYSREDGLDWDQFAEGSCQDWVLAILTCEAILDRVAAVNAAREVEMFAAMDAAAEADARLAAAEADEYDLDDPAYNP